MKFKVKVLMLLVSMLFSALGVSAEIADGQYKIMNVEKGSFLKENSGGFSLIPDESSASIFSITASGDGYTIVTDGKYLASDGMDAILSNEPQNCGITCDGQDFIITFGECGLYFGYGSVYFDSYYNDPDYGGDYKWQLIPVGGGEPTPTYTYQVYLSGAPSGTKILFDGVEKVNNDKVTIEYELTNDNVNDHVVAILAGYQTQVSMSGTYIHVEYTRVYTYTVKFAEGSPSDAYVTVAGVSGRFGNNATFTRDTKISNFNTEITPKSYSGRTSQVIGTKTDDYNYIATVTYYQASLTSGKYYRFATSEYMLKAAPDQSYEDEGLSNLVVSVDDKSDMNNIWQAVQVGEGNLMYLRHANSEQYLSKKQNDGTYTLVATTEQAGKFSKEGDSMREGVNYLTIADGNLTTSNEPSAIWSRTAEVDVVTLTLNDYGYATTCMPFNFTVSEGAEIYGTIDVHDYSGYTTLKVHQVERVAQAGQGYIIKGEPRAEGEPQKTVTLTPTTSEADDEAESSMLGTLIRQTGVYTALGYKYYGFKGDEFVLASSDAIPANKAVYIPASPSSVMRMSLGFDEGLTTDILGLTPDASASQPLYDLQGRSCMGQSHKGFYIQSGHKMIRR